MGATEYGAPGRPDAGYIGGRGGCWEPAGDARAQSLPLPLCKRPRGPEPPPPPCVGAAPARPTDRLLRSRPEVPLPLGAWPPPPSLPAAPGPRAPALPRPRREGRVRPRLCRAAGRRQAAAYPRRALSGRGVSRCRIGLGLPGVGVSPRPALRPHCLSRELLGPSWRGVASLGPRGGRAEPRACPSLRAPQTRAAVCGKAPASAPSAKPGLRGSRHVLTSDILKEW